MTTIERNRHVYTDGGEEETIRVVAYNLKSPEEVEQLGHELLRAAVEWRAEIETRGPPGPPAFKTFDFISWTGGRKRIASWVEHPWALVRRGGGASVAFLVQEQGDRFKAWIVSAKLENGAYRWKCRFECSSAVETRDLIQAFPCTLPDSPTLGDIEFARARARVSMAAPSA